MAIIVSGKIVLKPNQRDTFIEKSLTSIALARETEGCQDFAVSPDPLEADRVNIYEKWMNREALEAFRKSGPEDDLLSLIEAFDIKEYDVSDNTT